jgi:hypothetical protein
MADGTNSDGDVVVDLQNKPENKGLSPSSGVRTNNEGLNVVFRVRIEPRALAINAPLLPLVSIDYQARSMDTREYVFANS